jgi:DNA-directed RNA polymerase subunit RPC12/RpoP
MPIRKIPVVGFLISCMKCGGRAVVIEARQDGTDLKCQKCGNKLLLRPGEILTIQVPKNLIDQKIAEKTKEFEERLSKTPMDDWPSGVLEDWIKKNEQTNE